MGTSIDCPPPAPKFGGMACICSVVSVQRMRGNTAMLGDVQHHLAMLHCSRPQTGVCRQRVLPNGSGFPRTTRPMLDRTYDKPHYFQV